MIRPILRRIGPRMLAWSGVAPACVAVFLLLIALRGLGAEASSTPVLTQSASLPLAPEAYGDAQVSGLWQVLRGRMEQQPLNLWATLIFLGALLHTFFCHKFRHWSHLVEARHSARLESAAELMSGAAAAPVDHPTSLAARVLHFLSEVEAVFGIWVVPLATVLTLTAGWTPTLDYIEHRVSYDEALFVVVIMILACTRPILGLAERSLRMFARLGGSRPGAWWLSILSVGPVLGSLITEPAAMTISALLLAKQFYTFKPSVRFGYATLGLLFVNISVGGVLTHFAAPPVLMVAGPWGWNTRFMFRHFGWVALLGILVANALYFLVFRNELAGSKGPVCSGATNVALAERPETPIPGWVTAGHVLFMAWSVWNAHHPVLLIGGFLFFLAFAAVTEDYQDDLQLRSPILVGFFLAGLVVHGGLQQWWIGPVLSHLKEIPLLVCATGLTALIDNAAITYLATLVPGLTDSMKYAVVAGAVSGGGLTVIANAPNPAGQAILGRFFPDGISPLGLLLGALPATLIMVLCFLLLG